MRRLWFGISILFILFSSGAGAQEEPNKVHISLVADQKTIQPGTPFTLGILFEIEKGWHTYYKDPGDAGAPPQFKWVLPEGFVIGELQWPPPLKLVEPGDIHVNAYEEELFIWAEVTTPKDLSAKEVSLKVDANWLVCEKLCIPESGSASLNLPVRPETPKRVNQPLFNKYLDAAAQFSYAGPTDGTIWKYLLFAFIGGLILNLMPCVLPVISLKALSFIRMAHQSKKRMAALGVAFTGGVLASFITLAAIILSLKTIGQEIGWGFQFQYPGFVIVIAALIFAMGLSLAGLFEITLAVPKKGVSLTQQEGLGGAFFYGVLATILATPCTAPFMGVTIGFAFTGTAVTIFSIFGAMGLGLAFPFLLLSLNPGWTRLIPKPGPWMEWFKELMAFLLFATVVWLLWVIGRQVGLDGMIWTLAFLVCLALAAWIYGKVQFAGNKIRNVWIVILIGFVFLSARYFVQPLFQLYQPDRGVSLEETGIPWIPYDPVQFQKVASAGKPIFLDFTADWCLTCKVNEKTVLNQPDIVAKFEELGIVGFKLDWTHQDKKVTQLLKNFGRFGVPLYVYYPEGNRAPPQVLPELLTKAGVLKVLERKSIK